MPSTQEGDGGVFAKIPESIRWDLEHGRARDVLIELIDRDMADAGAVLLDAAGPDAGRYDNEAANIAPLARSVHDETGESVIQKADRYRQLQERVLSQSKSDAVSVRFQYVNIPLLHVTVRDLSGLLSLTRNPEVLAVYEDTRMEHQLAESLPLINQPAAATAGKLGAGTAVAVLDTGCDFTRSAFGSCASAGAANCKVAVAKDFGVSDNVKDTGNFHGTNVSGIVLGVAPSTKILALDVFESTTASSSTILQAVDWVISNRATYNIVAMNLSLGSGLYTSICSGDGFATGIANARAAGVLSAIASGNTASSSSISSPACVPAAISVGAVWDAAQGSYTFGNCSDPNTAADKVTCFSNSASFLSILAPGAFITAAGIPMTGTSQASPHVAGAIAVVRAAFPSEPLSATVTRLTSTGPTITDARNGVAVHRLDLNAALGGAGVVDVTAPSGSFTINAGATATRTTAVTLALSASDDSSPVSMCVSNTATCTTYTAVTASKTWALTTGDGVKTVYVTFRDPTGNKTTLTRTIRLDAVAPTASLFTATPGNAQAALSWTAGSDAGSGVASYRVQGIASATPPGCTTGTTVYSGTGTSYTQTGLSNGATYSYRLCPIDAAGNIGVGPSLTTRPAPEFDSPTGGTVKINQDATYTNKASVTLNLSAADASGIGAVCVSNTTTCTAFSTFTSSKAWSLATTNGTQTVRVWFRDSYGNVTASPASDSIILDSAVPSTNTLSAVADDAEVTLTWTAATDAISGIYGYKVTSALNTTPTCSSGTTVYTGSALTTTVTGLTNGSTYGFRVCPIDGAGNMASGGVSASRPAPEFDGPTGTVAINQGAQFTNSKTVTLTLAATDASDVPYVCISNTTTCTAFVANATSKTWALGVASGTATVRVWFRDIYGNVSASPASDSIVLDVAPPIANTLSATPGDTKVTLNWSAATDASSGIYGYKVTSALNSAPTCNSGTVVYTGTALTTTVTGLTNGSLYVFRVCPIDNVGNMASAGSVATRPAPEFDAPTGTVSINQAAQFTNSKTVTLTLSESDASGTAYVCISNGATCTAYVPYAGTKTWALVIASGTATVRVWFMDIYGNVSATPASDTIGVDTTAPTANALSVQVTSGSAALHWAAASDTGSGIAGYRIKMAPNVAPTCAAGTQVYSGTALSFTQTGLTNGLAYGYRVCPFDAVGNTATGGSVIARPQ